MQFEMPGAIGGKRGGFDIVFLVELRGNISVSAVVVVANSRA